MVWFHYYERKEALTLATHNRSHIDYKGDRIQIFSDLSPITLANRHSPLTFNYIRSLTSGAFRSASVQQKMVPNIPSGICKKEILSSKTSAYHDYRQMKGNQCLLLPDFLQPHH